MIETALLAVALATDAMAVAAGRAITGITRRRAITLATSFGCFHAAMAATGWALGHSARTVIQRWDHWIAFALLASIGTKMIIDSIRRYHSEGRERLGVLDVRTTLLLSIATSIDTLAVGVTLPILSAPPVVAVVFFGVAAFAATLVGSAAGANFGARFGPRLEAAGGIALIGMGVKILVTHLLART